MSMRICTLRKIGLLGILGILSIFAIHSLNDTFQLYGQCSTPTLASLTTIESSPVITSQTIFSSGHCTMEGRAESVQNRCSPTKGIHHNGADLQVSDLVENLPFEQGTSGNLYPDLQALPASEEVTVFILPHSHCDPGWLRTYESYYTSEVRPLLTNLHRFAMDHDDFKYIYAEVSFFKLWWEEQSEEVRKEMGQLAREGRFEFVQGGWVQNDEANTHYFAILNQMMDGHEWLKRNFPGAIPRAGWAIDPFGLSPFMAQVNKLFGLDSMHIQRVHYTLKQHLAENRNLEFRWRQSWDDDGTTDMLTHMGPFGSYCPHDTCGPDRDVCAQFIFLKLGPNSAGKDRRLVKTTPENVKERSLLILDQWRKKAALHASNAVFIETGCDFSYRYKGTAEAVYENYKPIMEYISNSPELKTQVKWGTLSDYFDHIKKSNITFPSLSGDFFTYADRSDQYWSGYYTSRPFYKNLDRVLESSLRRTEILFSFYRAKEGVKELTDARNTLSLFQHHDAITGTAKKLVVEDYGNRLFSAYKACEQLSIAAVKHIENNVNNTKRTFQSTKLRRSRIELEKHTVFKVPADLIVANTIARDSNVAKVIAVQSRQNFEVVSSGDEVVPQQFEPAIEYGKLDLNSEFIVFWTELPSVSISFNKFRVTRSKEYPDKDRTSVELYNFANKTTEMSLQSAFQVVAYDTTYGCEDIVLGSDKLVITLECKSGRLKNLHKEGRSVAIEQEVLLYKSDRSGAYLFLPNGDPSQILLDSSRPEIVVIKGPIRDKAVVTLKFLSGSTLVLTYIVYHHPGLEGQFVELKMMSDLKHYGDLAIRFKTDIKSGDSIFTDLNGHTIQQHKFKRKLLTQGNFFPMPSTAFIQDSSTRFSLLGSEPHGVASLAQGWIEVIIDRRTSQDDHKGLEEKVDDNIPTPANLRILVEARSETQTESELYMVEYPSLVSHMTLQSLLHPPFLLSATLVKSDQTARIIQLMRSLPCDEELVNLRYIGKQTSQLIRRKLGFSCDIDMPVNCDNTDPCLEKLFAHDVTIEDHPFSALHQKTDFNKSDFRAMEFSSKYVTFKESILL